MTASALEIKQLLASLGTTVVLVTHDQEEALSLADVVAILYDGRIVQHATPRAIYQHPETLAVAHFLGDTNLVAAHFNGGTAHTPLGELLIEDSSQSKGDGLVLIRPEQILLTPGNNGHRPPLTARVTAVTYFGHDAIARLSLETGTGPLELIARTRGDLAPRVDAHVTLAFDGAMRTYDGQVRCSIEPGAVRAGGARRRRGRARARGRRPRAPPPCGRGGGVARRASSAGSGSPRARGHRRWRGPPRGRRPRRSRSRGSARRRRAGEARELAVERRDLAQSRGSSACRDAIAACTT